MQALVKGPLVSVALLLGVLCAAPAAAQDSLPGDTERELIVAFRPGVVGRPPGVVAGPLDVFSFPPELQRVLASAGVEHMAQLIAGFEPEDRFVRADWGEVVELTDWSDTYVLRLVLAAARPALLALLNERRREVAYAEPNARGEPAAVLHEGGTPYALDAAGPLAAAVPPATAATPSSLIPNDAHFARQWALKNDSTAIQGYGKPGADIRATEAWELETGESWVKVGIVDSGMNTTHPDFAGRVTGDPTDLGLDALHGTFVTGFAAAQGNNAIGIAGVAWNVGIINEDFGTASADSFAAAIRSAYIRGAHVTNNSWLLLSGYSVQLRLAFADGYRLGRTAVASMGNYGLTFPRPRYPAAYGQGIIAVGATTNEDHRALYSSHGNWIDVTAPGGYTLTDPNQICNGDPDCLYGAIPGSPYYDYHATGTSFAAPHVTGLAALLISFSDDNLHLYPDDLEQLIRRSAKDLNASDIYCTAVPDFDPCYGTGRIDARAALDLLGGGQTLVRGLVTGGGTVVATSALPYTVHFHTPPGDGLPDGPWAAIRHTVERTVPIGPYTTVPQAWGRGAGPLGGGLVYLGWGEEQDDQGTRYSYGLPYTEVVTVSTTSITLRTYVYQVDLLPEDLNPGAFYPTSPANVGFAYTLLACCVSGSGAREAPPAGTALHEVRPNPFGEQTEIDFAVPSAGRVRVAIYDVLGREVARLVDGEREAGSHRVRFEASDLPAGVYLVRLVAGTTTLTRRMTRLR